MSKRDLRKWEVRGERELLDASPFLKVSAQRIELPDGRVVENFYQLAMPDFASIFAETEDGRILVLRAYRHGAKRVCLAAPGGHLSPGEAPLAAAKRELLEETGYEAALWQPLGSFITNANHRCQTAHFFRASGCRKVAAANSGDLEETELVLMSRAQVIAAFKAGEFPFVSQVALFGLAFGAALAGTRA